MYKTFQSLKHIIPRRAMEVPSDVSLVSELGSVPAYFRQGWGICVRLCWYIATHYVNVACYLSRVLLVLLVDQNPGLLAGTFLFLLHSLWNKHSVVSLKFIPSVSMEMLLIVKTASVTTGSYAHLVHHVTDINSCCCLFYKASFQMLQNIALCTNVPRKVKLLDMSFFSKSKS